MRLVGEGRHAQAAERLAGIAQEFPQAAEVRYRLGLLRLRENRLDEAEAQLGAAVRLSPRSAPAWLGLAQVQLRQRRRADALESARRAMEHAAQDEPVRKALAMLHAQLARQYREEKDAPRAVEAWQDAMRLDPGEPGHVLEAAQVFLDHRTFEPAVLLLERAAARFPRHAEVLRFLGLA
jgi:tetratricopeptide (TPR) repeat protein